MDSVSLKNFVMLQHDLHVQLVSEFILGEGNFV